MEMQQVTIAREVSKIVIMEVRIEPLPLISGLVPENFVNGDKIDFLFVTQRHSLFSCFEN